jgi:site-specific DNA recombinase
LALRGRHLLGGRGLRRGRALPPYTGDQVSIAGRTLHYYRCFGSGNRHQGGPVCDSRPVRADYLDEVVWGHVTALLAGPALVQAELDRRLAEIGAAIPATSERARLERELARTTKAVTRLVQAYQGDLLTLEPQNA